MKEDKPLAITFYEGPASADFAGTLMDHMTRSIEKNQLFIISSNAYSEMQKQLSIRHLPCRLLGRQQIPGWIAQKAGIEETETADEHSRTRILEQILSDPSMDLQFLAASEHPETAARDLGTLIGRLQKSGVQPAHLEEIMKRRFASSASRARFHDLLLVMKSYLTELRRQGRESREDFMLEMASVLSGLDISTGDVFIGILDDYDYVTRKLLASIIIKAESVSIALPVVPHGKWQKANAHYKRAARFYKELIREVKSGLQRPLEIRQELAAAAVRTSALDQLSNWLEKISPEFPQPDTSIQLVQCLNLDDELVGASRAVAEIIAQGASPSEILVTGATIGTWHEQLSRLLAAEGVDSVYYQGETLSRSPVYGYFSSLLSWLEHPDQSGLLSRLLQYEGLGLEQDDIRVLQHFILSQGPDFEGGRKRLQQICDAAAGENEKLHSQSELELQQVDLALDHLGGLTGCLKTQLDQAVTVRDFCQAVLDFAETGCFLKFLRQTWEEAKTRDVTLADTLQEQWKAFNRLLLQVERLFGSEQTTPEKFRTLIDQMADEVIVSTSGQRHCSVQMEPLHSARTVHCAHLFILSAGSDEIPVLPNPAFITDRETSILKAAGIDFRSNSDWADESVTDAVTAIANTSRSVWISWHIRSEDQEIEPASVFQALAAILPVDDRSGHQLAEDAFLLDLIELQSHVGKAEYDEVSRILQLKYGSSEQFAHRLEKADAWVHKDWNTIDQSAAAEHFRDLSQLSVTSLESYNQCPLRFFMQRALKSRDPRHFEETSADRGTFLHEVLNICVKTAQEKNIKPDDSFQLEQLLEKTVNTELRLHNRRILESGGLMQYEKDTLKQAASDSLKIVMKQNSSSEFQPQWLEYSIGQKEGFEISLPDGKPFRLTGIADRVDVWKAPDGTEYARVIDYKSARDKKQLDTESVENGLHLQPPLYLNAVMKEKNLKPAGMYYDRLKVEDISLKAGESPFDPVLEKKRLSSRQMSGVTLNKAPVLEASDTGFKADAASYTSGVIPLSTTVKGTLTSQAQKSAVTEEQLEHLMETALDKSAQTVTAMKEGRIAANPQKEGGKSPCTWCSFRLSCHRNHLSD